MHRCTVQLTYGKRSHIASIRSQWMNGIVVGRGVYFTCVKHFSQSFCCCYSLIHPIVVVRPLRRLFANTCICVLKALFTQNNKWQMHIITQGKTRMRDSGRGERGQRLAFCFHYYYYLNTRHACMGYTLHVLVHTIYNMYDHRRVR